MSKRIDIVLPEATVAVLNQTLRERLKEGYATNAEESLRIAAEWFPLEEEFRLTNSA
jgi:hypothetical protein